jgi:hypothetical protein
MKQFGRGIRALRPLLLPLVQYLYLARLEVQQLPAVEAHGVPNMGDVVATTMDAGLS